ncbi:MAG: type II toxin-antitoxin system HicA family toxin [Candidatus Heimdallarchaeota archaeon]
MKLRPLPYRRVAKRLREMGFQPIRQTGSHVMFEHADGRKTVVPKHPGEEIGRGLLRKIIKDVNVSVREFMERI